MQRSAETWSLTAGDRRAVLQKSIFDIQNDNFSTQALERRLSSEGASIKSSRKPFWLTLKTTVIHSPVAVLNIMGERPIRDLARDILRFQKQDVIDSLVSKLADEHVHVAADFLVISKDALEIKLYNRGNLCLDETSHTMSLREWAENHVGENSTGTDMSIGGSQTPWRQDSSERQGKIYRQGPRSRSPWQSRGKGKYNQGKGSWNRGKGDRQVDSRGPRRELPKPPIWAAVEQGDFSIVSRLMSKGYDIEQ